MHLLLQRFSKGADDTLGIMYLVQSDGRWDDQGFVLEDETRDRKVAKETCIPAGSYKVVPREVGGLIKKYKKEFKDHHSMLWLHQLNTDGTTVLNAAGAPVIKNAAGDEWQYCYIHRGNHEGNTDGCPLIAWQCDARPDPKTGRRRLMNSNECYDTFRKMIYAAWERGEEVLLAIWESDIAPPQPARRSSNAS